MDLQLDGYVTGHWTVPLQLRQVLQTRLQRQRTSHVNREAINQDLQYKRHTREKLTAERKQPENINIKQTKITPQHDSYMYKICSQQAHRILLSSAVPMARRSLSKQADSMANCRQYTIIWCMSLQDRPAAKLTRALMSDMPASKAFILSSPVIETLMKFQWNRVFYTFTWCITARHTDQRVYTEAMDKD